MPLPRADLDLARRLERAEAESSASFVEARAAADPASGAIWHDFSGAYAMFDGPESPITQTFGLGLFSPATPALLDEIETFFFSRQADVNHEVSPLAGIETYQLLAARDYTPAELSSVLYRDLDNLPSPPASAVTTRIAHPGELDEWAEVSANGWSTEAPGLREFILEIGKVMARKQNSTSWLAFVDGQPVAAAALSICGSVAHLAGASTIPQARGQGAQNALFAARLAYAQAQGCELALVGASPGSASQRNAERRGFRIAYTRLKWMKSHPSKS